MGAGGGGVENSRNQHSVPLDLTNVSVTVLHCSAGTRIICLHRAWRERSRCLLTVCSLIVQIALVWMAVLAAGVARVKMGADSFAAADLVPALRLKAKGSVPPHPSPC
jgi:hypothetical protein